MFHKEFSSITSSSNNGKKYKDVTLRKSDRKVLLQNVHRFFNLLEVVDHDHHASVIDDLLRHTTENQATGSAATNTHENTVPDALSPVTVGNYESSSTLLLLLIDDIFLRNGEIYERTMNKLTTSSFITLNETSVVNVYQYYRSPSSLASFPSSSSTKQKDSNHVTAWPYTMYPQCVWMRVEVLLGGQNITYHIPGLALLSVLPPSLFAPYVTSVPSPLSEYICANGVKHIMRVGLRSIPMQRQNTATPDAATSLKSTTTKNISNGKIGMTTIVCVQGNPQPICVGILHPDLLNNDIDDSTKNTDPADIVVPPLFGPGCPKGGIGVSIIHAYGDDIWRQQVPTPKEIDHMQEAMCHSTRSPSMTATATSYIINPLGQSIYDLGHYGNKCFIDGTYVNPILVQGQSNDDNTPAITTATLAIENDHEPTNDEIGNDETLLKQLENIQLTAVDDDELPENDVTYNENNTNTGSDKITTSHDEQGISMTPDEILHDAVCRALATLNVKKDLPITMATFYAQHVLPNRKDGTTIQLKQTRYKKFSTYVKEQVDNGLLVVGKHVSSNHVTDPMGLLINFDRKDVELIPYIKAQKEEVAALAEAGIVIGEPKRLEIADLYCVPNHFVSLLHLDSNVVKAVDAKSEERRGTGMLTAKEVRSILDEYITNEDMIDSSQPDIVILNGPLTDALYKKKKKKSFQGVVDSNESSTPLSLPRKELVKLWMACQESAYALVQLPGNRILKLKRGKPPVITLEVSRRQSNKYVTTVIGLELYDINLSEFAKDVANRFACASTVDKESTSAATDVVVVQGNLSIELEALLLSDEKLTGHGGVKGSTYYLPKNSIHIVLKKGVPARKKTQPVKK